MTRTPTPPHDHSPEPLEYHQPGHPAAHARPTKWNWREPLLSPSECDHERTARRVRDGLGGEVAMTQCLDCAEVVKMGAEQVDIMDASPSDEGQP
jgi:hypothetical protein